MKCLLGAGDSHVKEPVNVVPVTCVLFCKFGGEVHEQQDVVRDAITPDFVKDRVAEPTEPEPRPLAPKPPPKAPAPPAKAAPKPVTAKEKAVPRKTVTAAAKPAPKPAPAKTKPARVPEPVTGAMRRRPAGV